MKAPISLALVLLTLTGSLPALDLSFPVSFPDVTGLSATLHIDDSPVEIVVNIAPDPRGKYACADGGCTVNGRAVDARGKIKARPGADGESLYFFSGSLKSPRGTAKTERVKLSFSGEVTSGIADFKYRGPEGKATLTGHPAEVLGDLGLKLGSLSIDPSLFASGNLGASARLSLGLSNDSAEEAPLKIKIAPCKVTLTLKIGKRKATLKAASEDGLWIGTLKINAKPVKIVEDLVLPAETSLAALTGCVDSLPENPEPPEPPVTETGCGTQNETLFAGELVGENHTQGYWNVNRTSRGFIVPGASLSIVSSDPFEANDYRFSEESIEGRCLDIDPAPNALGPWLTAEVVSYDGTPENNLIDAGEIRLEITSLDPLGGVWMLVGPDGVEVARGPWVTHSGN